MQLGMLARIGYFCLGILASFSGAFTSSPLICHDGWLAHDRSCYKFYYKGLSWENAKKACRYTGGHLVRIDSSSENDFLANITRRYYYSRHKNFWIGLHDPKIDGRFVWEFLPNQQVNYTNWYSSAQNATSACVEMFNGNFGPGLWSDARCSSRNWYICEKEEGKNSCPEDWISYNDDCYQFNMGMSQKMSWSDAKAACRSVSDFASLVKITNQDEQDFITRQIRAFSYIDTWIGLNDIRHETIFRWSSDNTDLTTTHYENWANRNPTENSKSSDCVMILGVRQDGAWTVQNCSLLRNFICVRHRDMPFCNVPLGMANGKIADAQIDATSSISAAHGPQKARFNRHNFSWCPDKTDQNEYLQVDLLSIYNIRKIAIEGSVVEFTVRHSVDGKRFKTYKRYTEESARTKLAPWEYDTVSLASVKARFVQIYPNSWKNHPCLSVEFIGCPETKVPPSSECSGKNWEKGPGDLCYQVHANPMAWPEARSVCLDEGGDLLSVKSEVEQTAILNRLKDGRTRWTNRGFWMSLSDRDYQDYFYWSSNEATSFTNWGSGMPDTNNFNDETNNFGCIIITYNRRWKDARCSDRYPFVCMKRDPSIPPNVTVNTETTGMWMGSAKYYWPLSAIDNNMILGTRLGKVYGKVTLTMGVKGKPNSALQFSNDGSYIDVGMPAEKECFSSPDYCWNGLTLSFIAAFDKDAISWSKRVNILDSVRDEKNFLGIGVYIENQQLWFVVSKSYHYVKTKIAITGDEVLRFYVMRWNGSYIDISVNSRPIFTKSIEGSGRNNASKNFVIGIPPGLAVSSGKVTLAMVSFWDWMISKKDIIWIYKSEFGKCPFGWNEYGMSCYQLNRDKKDFYSATTQCRRSGGDLLYMDSNVEQAYITNHVIEDSWIGVNGDEYWWRRRLFKLNNKNELRYSNWGKGQPSTWPGDHAQCTRVLPGGLWKIVHACNERAAYICEKQKEMNVSKTMNISSIVVTGLACYKTHTKLGCPSGLVVKINTAFWGMRDRNLCTDLSINSCGVMNIGKTTSSLKKRCDNARTCDLYASENEPYLNDPCPGINKYLQVNYSCVRQSDKQKCKTGWKFYGDACYRLFDTPRAWNDSRMICQKSGAELLSIISNMEQVFATNLMERAWYSNVWTGLNDLKTKGVYKWSDGSPVSWTNWYVGEPEERRRNKSCVFMSLERSIRGLMYWRDQNCADEYPFICKYYVHQTPTSPTVTGSCGYGWKTSLKLAHCYKVIAANTGWSSAQASCHYNEKAKLASVHSKEENEFIRKLTTRSSWIGLEGIGVYRGYKWLDGEPVRYTNWADGQPDSYHGIEACVHIDPSTGRWSDADCIESAKDAVCKKPKANSAMATPTTHPTPGSPLCKAGWTLFQGMCYLTGSYRVVDVRTWHEAEKRCQMFNGHLASINSKAEQDFIEFLFKDIHNRYYRYWIGLSDIRSESTYIWSDGSAFTYYNWDSYEPDDDERQEDCISVGKVNGKWKDNNCQLKFSYICKSYNESYIPPVTPKPSPSPTDIYCSPGWISHGQHCYQFNSDPSQYKTWPDARDSCHEGRNSTDRGELVTIVDVVEQAFIITHLQGAKRRLWIGLNNRLSFSGFVWVDNHAITYLNWNVNQPPKYSSNLCVAVVVNRWTAGKWNGVDCYKLNGYICKTARKQRIKKPTRKPKGPNKCPTDYKLFKSSCYKFFNSQKTFDDARKTCQSDGGDVIDVDTHIKQAYLAYLVERFTGSVWIGLLHKPYSVFKFSDHRLAPYTYWGKGQPNRQNSQRSCTQANITRNDFGVWDDVDCSATNHFVCEIYRGEPKVTIPLDAACPYGWRQHDKYCYKYNDNGKEWTQAQFYCARMGANLLSIHDDRELDFLMYWWRSIGKDYVWTGLSQRELELGFKWNDKSPLDYVNWKIGEPKDYYGSKNCVKMHTKTGLWETAKCDDYVWHICKRPLECSSVLSVDPSMVQVTDTYNASTLGADKAIIREEKAYSSSWCSNDTSGKAKIIVNFDQVIRVTAITIQGRETYDRENDDYEDFHVSSFRVDYRRNGYWRPYYTHGTQTTIEGLERNDLSISRTFKHPLTLDALTVTPVRWFGRLICMKIQLLGCDYVCQRLLLSVFPDKIADDFVTTSSSKHATNEPRQVAMEGHSWCSKVNDKNQWLQFNFAQEHLISKITTAGNKIDSYVKKYSLQFSNDGNTWIDYAKDGVTRVFKGNNDAFHAMTHTIYNPIEASYVRVIPMAWSKNICMRVSLLGCESDCDQPLLASSKSNTKFQYSSSDKNSIPEYALFNTGTAWCTDQSPLSSQYLEINLGRQYRVTKIATRPSPLSYHTGGQVSTYTLKYKGDDSWVVYEVQGKAKVMTAINKTALSKPMFNALTNYYRKSNGLLAKGIRIYPKDFNGTVICMKAELYGCPKEPEISPTAQTSPSIAQEILDVSIRFTSIEWNHKLKDRSSEEFGKTGAKITHAVRSVYREKEFLRGVKILKLIKGSVVAEIEISFNPELITVNNVTSLLEVAVKSGQVASLEVDKTSFKRLKDKDGDSNDRIEEHNDLSGAAVAGITVTVLLVALGVGIFGYCFYKKRTGSKQYDYPNSYSMAKLNDDATSSLFATIS